MIEISPSSVMQTRAFLFSEKGRKHMFDKIKADIKSVRERDPAVKSDLEVFFPVSQLQGCKGIPQGA